MAGTRISDIQKMTEAGVDVVFNRAAKMPKRKYYGQICTERQEMKQVGSYHTIGDLGAASVKVEADTVNFDRIQENYETNITSTTKAKGVEASLESLEYDLERVVKGTFGTALLQKLQILKEKEVAACYNEGFATDTMADGVYVFSNTHPLQGNVLLYNDNLMSGALTGENLITAKNMFNSIYDQSGELFDTEPTTLAIHPNKLYLALQILGSSLMALELSNTKNVVNDFMPIKVVTNKYFTDGYWFLIDKTLEDAGCILQTKRGVTLKTWWVNENQVFRGLAYEMYGAAFISPGYGLVGSAG